jgi:Flp pilus assembly pilin Flp
MDERAREVSEARTSVLWQTAKSGWRPTRGRSERGAILVEYGMLLIAVLVVSLALAQIFGARVVEMFQGVLDGFG